MISILEFAVLSPLNAMLSLVCVFLLKKLMDIRTASSTSSSCDVLSDASDDEATSRSFTIEELSNYNGRTPGQPIYIALAGTVFNVTIGSSFYSPDGPYGIFAGRDASRLLACDSLEPEMLRDGYDDLRDLNDEQMERLSEWQQHFAFKYPKVGTLKRHE